MISPESAYLYRDSGMTGDAVSRHVVEQAAAFLEEGAFAQMLVSWVVAPGDHWSVALRTWVAGSGCDAWLLHDDTVDPLTHAGAWLRHEARGDSDAHAAALDRWLAYFERLGIEMIAVGAVILRRRNGANWVLADELSSDRLGQASDHILRVFAAQDFLTSTRDEQALLAESLALDEHAQLEQRVAYRDGGWNADEIAVTLRDGLGFRATLDGTTGGMLAALDGRRTLGQVAGDLARLQGVSPEEAERALLPVARQMLVTGFLVRV